MCVSRLRGEPLPAEVFQVAYELSVKSCSNPLKLHESAEYYCPLMRVSWATAFFSEFPRGCHYSVVCCSVRNECNHAVRGIPLTYRIHLCFFTLRNFVNIQCDVMYHVQSTPSNVCWIWKYSKVCLNRFKMSISARSSAFNQTNENLISWQHYVQNTN